MNRTTNRPLGVSGLFTQRHCVLRHSDELSLTKVLRSQSECQTVLRFLLNMRLQEPKSLVQVT
jgi:hypothetical protein